MRLRTLIAIAVTMCTLPALAGELPVAPAPRAAERVAVFTLKHTAAADVALVIERHLKARKIEAVLVAEPVSNRLFLSADSEALRVVGDILAVFDREPPQVTLTVTAVKVPDGFAEQSGLNIGAAPNVTSWTLSPRELHMLTGLIRAAKERGECEVLTRPVIVVTDNRTESVEIGQQIPVADGAKPAIVTTFRLQATPRVRSEGGLLLRTEIQIIEKGSLVVGTTTKPGSPFPVVQRVPTFNARTHPGTAELKTGETLVTRAGDLLVLITPTVSTK